MMRILGKAAKVEQDAMAREMNDPIEKKLEKENEGTKCPHCGFIAKNKIGLIAHLRRHKE